MHYTQYQKLAGASLLIFANKQDIKGALNVEQIAAFLDFQGKIGANRHCHVQSCSAITGEGLLEGVQWIVHDIASRIFLLE
jgi:ADP-ribosylation factor-like protein 2